MTQSYTFCQKDVTHKLLKWYFHSK